MNNESFYKVVIGRVGTTPGTPTSISKPYPTSCLLSYSHRYTPGFCCSTKISLALRCHYFNSFSKTPKELVPLCSVDSVFPPRWSAAPSQAPCTQPGLCVFQSQSAAGHIRIPFLCLSSFHCVQTSALEALLSPWEPVQLSALICYSLLAVPAAALLPFIVLCLPPSADHTGKFCLVHLCPPWESAGK